MKFLKVYYEMKIISSAKYTKVIRKHGERMKSIFTIKYKSESGRTA